MATFALLSQFQFTFRNHTNHTEIYYDLRDISRNFQNCGNITPGKVGISIAFDENGGFDNINIPVVGIGQFDQPQVVPPGVHFALGDVGVQYINLLAGNGYTVTQDTPTFNEVTGNGFRITLDGGGLHNPTTIQIFFQVYNV